MSENGLEKTYVDPKDRVLDPSLISSTLLERMPSPTVGGYLYCRTGVKVKQKAVYCCQIS